jgi:transposase InsO family protein
MAFGAMWTRRINAVSSEGAKLVGHAGLLDRNFTTSAPNRILLADITYIPTGEGWL